MRCSSAFAFVAVGLSIILGSALAPAVSAQDDGPAPDLVLDGTELVDCLPDRVYCFIVAEGNLDDVFVAGEEVTLQLSAAGQAPHNVHVAVSGTEDENNLDTPADAAIAASDTADAGASVNLTFTVPADAEALYLWCDVGDHEAGGMWLEAPVNAAPAASNETAVNDTDDENASDDEGDEENASEDGGDGADENDTGDDATVGANGSAGEDGEDEDENGSPLPAWTVFVAVGLALVAARRATGRRR